MLYLCPIYYREFSICLTFVLYIKANSLYALPLSYILKGILYMPYLCSYILKGMLYMPYLCSYILKPILYMPYLCPIY